MKKARISIIDTYQRRRSAIIKRGDISLDGQIDHNRYFYRGAIPFNKRDLLREEERFLTDDSMRELVRLDRIFDIGGSYPLTGGQK